MKDISEVLNNAIDDESNETLLGLTTSKIKEMNLKVINELCLPKEEALSIMRKLNDYKYVDEMDDLKYGTYIRWIKLNNPDDLSLTKGAIFSDIKITEQGVNLICKNFGDSSKRFTIKMDECLIFRKLTNQELVLLSALDHLSNDK
jgi:hypothetical protein